MPFQNFMRTQNLGAKFIHVLADAYQEDTRHAMLKSNTASFRAKPSDVDQDNLAVNQRCHGRPD